MQENRLLLWTKGKFKLIASSRMATCYHPTPEGMGFLAGISVKTAHGRLLSWAASLLRGEIQTRTNNNKHEAIKLKSKQ